MRACVRTYIRTCVRALRCVALYCGAIGYVPFLYSTYVHRHAWKSHQALAVRWFRARFYINPFPSVPSVPSGKGFTPPYNPSPGPKTDGAQNRHRCQYLMDCISFCCFFVSVLYSLFIEPPGNINFIRANGRHRNSTKHCFSFGFLIFLGCALLCECAL